MTPVYLTQEDLANFPVYTKRQDLTRFLVRHELFKKVLEVHGSIVECGVRAGGGLMSWLHFSSIYEPYNHNRKVIGFDTFEGFPSVSEEDGKAEGVKVGGMGVPLDTYRTLKGWIEVHDRDRPLGHVPKVELVKGNACQTIPQFCRENRHIIISLLYLDFDIYAPTKKALFELAGRIPEGGIIAFDELNVKEWPGETQAFVESELGALGYGSLKRFPWQSTVSYTVRR